jgi:hypothetical protein
MFIRAVFLLILCINSIISETTVQMWDINNKLISEVASCCECYNAPLNLYRYYVEWDTATVDWYYGKNCDGNDIDFFSYSSGYVEYWNNGNQPASFAIDCDCYCGIYGSSTDPVGVRSFKCNNNKVNNLFIFYFNFIKTKK